MKKLIHLAIFAVYIVGVGTLYAQQRARATQTLNSFNCPTSVSSGAQFLCLLSGAVGAEVDISSNTNLVSTPDDCWIASPTKPACSFKAQSVTKAKSVVINAKLGKVSINQTVTVTPGTAPPPAPTLTTLVPASASITGAGTDVLTANLWGAAVAATSIAVTSSSPSLTVPASVPVPVGASAASFTAQSSAVTSQTAVTVKASLGGNTASTTITLIPVGPPPPPPTPYQVNLTWAAPVTSPDPVVKYDVLRNGTHLAFASSTNFTDLTVADGLTYAYFVASVDASGVESAPSNVYSVVIP